MYILMDTYMYQIILPLLVLFGCEHISLTPVICMRQSSVQQGIEPTIKVIVYKSCGELSQSLTVQHTLIIGLQEMMGNSHVGKFYYLKLLISYIFRKCINFPLFFSILLKISLSFLTDLSCKPFLSGHFWACRYYKVTSSRLVYYSILNSLGQRSQNINIKFLLHENPWVCY